MTTTTPAAAATGAARRQRSRARTGLGIDIGGSGIKGAGVDLLTGELVTERVRVPTPQPSTPKKVAAVVADVLEQVLEQLPTGRVADGGVSAAARRSMPLGVTFPAVIQGGVARTAANVDERWVGTDVVALLAQATGRAVHVVNDADAAGVAEARFGAAKDVGGVVVLATLGTGIGTALLVDGVLVPNSELGHLEVDGQDAETRASDSARERDDLSWKQWAKRLTRYFEALETVVWPDLVVVGGGVSKKADRFLGEVSTRAPLVAAHLQNQAGIVGAAALAAERAGR